MDRSELAKLANLAKLSIDESQYDEVAESINNVLALVDQLSAADTSDVVPMGHPLDAEQILRQDEVTESNQREAFQAIAPATENSLYLVPKVID